MRREFSWRDYDKFEEWLQDVLETMVEDLKNKDKEIERLNKEIKEYQEELEKADSITQSCIFEGKEEATKSYRKCLNLLEKQHSIIKEVREYAKEVLSWTTNEPITDEIGEHILEIVGKEK